MFSKAGVPCELTIVNRGSCKSKDLSNFAREYDFNHKMKSLSSSEFDVFEKAVKVFKNLWFEVDDRNVALMHYLNTPLSSGFSPAENLHGKSMKVSRKEMRPV